MVTRDAIITALSKVQEPELHNDLVSLGMIKDLEIKGGEVSFAITLTTPACPLKNRIENEARQAVSLIPGVTKIDIRMDADVVSNKVQTDETKLGVKNIIAISSGKGGVGKTTVAVNVSVSLSLHGARVGLLDADIYGPNVPIMMGVDHLPAQTGEKIQPATAHGVKIMSIGFLVKPGQPIVWRGPMLHTAVRQFIYDVDWGELDYLVVDLPPGTGDVQLSLAQLVPLTGGVIVTLPQRVARDDAARGLQMFRELNVPVLGIIENMSYLVLPDGHRMEVFGTGGADSLSDESGIPVLGKIPLEAHVRASSDQGVPMVISHPESPAALAFAKISERLAAAISVEVISRKSTSSTS